jgi:hypothetical protein
VLEIVGGGDPAVPQQIGQSDLTGDTAPEVAIRDLLAFEEVIERRLVQLLRIPGSAFERGYRCTTSAP